MGKKKAGEFDATFPCVMSIMPQYVFNKKDPIVLGVQVLAGICKTGTPICVPNQDFLEIGRIASIEHNHKVVETAKTGDEVCVKIQSTTALEAARAYGRHFDHTDELVSRVSRHSIELGKDDWVLMLKLKALFGIQ